MKETGKRANSLPGILAFAAGLLTCSPALLADLNSGLVAYYPFDGENRTNGAKEAGHLIGKLLG